MILDTRRLFSRLLRTFEIETVCDVGSMDGRDSLLFRRMLPEATVLALEPNPRAYSLMQIDRALERESIRILPVAARDKTSAATFYVIGREYGRGVSSLYRPLDDSTLSEIVDIHTVRLDELLAVERLQDSAIALWIDAEGAGFEVIEGCAGILGSTRMVHVEVETQPIIAPGQKLFKDVERALVDLGFALFATDQAPHVLQFNALFIQSGMLRRHAAAIGRLARRARLWRAVGDAAASFIPTRLRLGLGLPVTETRIR